jgi:hypothetical protein
LDLFSVPSTRIVEERAFVVSHGPLSRFPEWMRSGNLSNLIALCTAHRGPLQIAQGKSHPSPTQEEDDFVGAGGQASVTGINAQTLLRLGFTVAFGNLTETVPEGKPFLRELEQTLGLPACATMSAFANAPSSGLPLHHDANDQLLFQLKGNKVFTRALKPPVPHPRISVSSDGPTDLHFPSVYRSGFPPSKESVEREGLDSVQLSPGSCLFMPAGTWHRTEQQEDTCLSLVIALRAPSRLDLLVNSLRFYLGQSPEWRHPSYGLFGNVEHNATPAQVELDALIPTLTRQLKHLNTKTMIRCHLVSQIKDGDPQSYAAELTSEHFIRLPNSSVYRELSLDGQVRVKVKPALSIRTSLLEFEEHALSLFESILETHASFTCQELCAAHPDFEVEDIAAFCMQLAQAGLLRPLCVPSWNP